MKSRWTETEARASGRRGAGPAGAGYTLLELLVAMTILVILGGGLIALLKQGITTWHIAEKRGAIYDRARIVLDQVAEDLRAATGDTRSEETAFWVRFLCDRDPQGKPRLRFTRALSGESTHPIAREGGKFVETGPGKHYDLHGDAAEAQAGHLLAPAGLEEVLYAMDPDPEKNALWRGVRSPVGGAGSLFIDRNVEAEPGREKPGPKKTGTARPEASEAGVALAQSATAPRKGAKTGAKTPAPPVDLGGPFERAARPFAEGIIHISFAFWTPYTTTWDPTVPARLPRGRSTEPSGPVFTWDSTRAILEEKGAAGEFVWRRVEDSLDDPDDDIFPERVEVTLVVQGNADVPAITLLEEVGPTDKTMGISRTEGLPDEGPGRLVKIEGEWIAYQAVERGRLVLAAGKGLGRGARGTAPARHPAGAAVELGTTFRRVVEIPAVRIGALEPEARRKRP